jgi:hypothetical protein
LAIQKTTKLFENLLAPVQLSPTKTYVEFDQVIQLIACYMPSTTLNLPMALSVSSTILEPHINCCQGIDKNSTITCGSSKHPCIRNSFIIRLPAQQHDHHQHQTINNSQYLKYGQVFQLECSGNSNSSDNKPLLLYSSTKSPLEPNPNYLFKANGEIKQSVAIGSPLQQPSTNNVINVESPAPSFCLWRCFHINPDERYESIGQFIPVCIKMDINTLFEHIYGHSCGPFCLIFGYFVCA